MQSDIQSFRWILIFVSLYIKLSGYYCLVFSAYFTFRTEVTKTCFNDELKNISLIFLLIFIGIVSFFRQAMNILALFFGFPVIIYMFYSNPYEFYTRIGIDPQIIDNLPTSISGKVEDQTCIICTEDITEGQEILHLKCPAK